MGTSMQRPALRAGAPPLLLGSCQPPAPSLAAWPFSPAFRSQLAASGRTLGALSPEETAHLCGGAYEVARAQTRLVKLLDLGYRLGVLALGEHSGQGWPPPLVRGGLSPMRRHRLRRCTCAAALAFLLHCRACPRAVAAQPAMTGGSGAAFGEGIPPACSALPA